MQNYTITEDFNLPSHGLVYDKYVNPCVQLRSMTTNDEMKRLSVGERQFKNMSDIIDSCIINELGIPSYDLCLGDYQYLLYMLRVVTYGADYKILCHCPHCLSNVEETLNIEALEIREYDDKIKEYLNFQLPKTGHTIGLRLQTPRIMDDTTVMVNQTLKKRPTEKKQGLTLLYTLKQVITEIDGEKPNAFLVEDFIKNLPMMDTNIILRNIELANEVIGVGNTLDIECEVCGLRYATPFRITPEFYGPSINK